MDNCIGTSKIPSIKNTCALVITYYPDNEVISRLHRIRQQLPSVMIIDNASDKNCLSILREFAESSSVKLLENDHNKGIAEALNQGASLAIELGFSWVLTLDQDTLIQNDMFDVLTEIYKSSNCSSPLIGSNYWDVHKNKPNLKCHLCAGKTFVERCTVLTAGTLLKLDLFQSIGGFRSDYFIDSVDHEYCLRARANGYVVLSSCKPLMSQFIGRPSCRGSLMFTSNQLPVRRYYMARNALVTAKSYFWHEPHWSVRQVIGLFVTFLSIVLFEKDKRNKLHAQIRGIVDALKNKMGPCDWA